MKELDQIILKSYKDRNTINLVCGLSKTYKTSFIRYIASLLNKHVIVLDFDSVYWFTDGQNAAIMKDKLIKRFKDLTIENKVILLDCYNAIKLLDNYPMLFDVFLDYCRSNNCILFVEHDIKANSMTIMNKFVTIVNMIQNKSWFEKLFRLDRITIRFTKNRYCKETNTKINPKNLFKNVSRFGIYNKL